jgi:carbamoyl-phosphate synthase small subunit
VSIKELRVFGPRGGPRILAYDCGIKYNIIRTFVGLGVELSVVPYDFELTEARYDEYDGIFVSNGPGNPEMAAATIEQLRRALQFGLARKVLRSKGLEGRGARTKPIFGICLGNQLLVGRGGGACQH